MKLATLAVWWFLISLSLVAVWGLLVEGVHKFRVRRNVGARNADKTGRSSRPFRVVDSGDPFPGSTTPISRPAPSSRAGIVALRSASKLDPALTDRGTSSSQERLRASSPRWDRW